ncbi:MAG: hypothetical protein JXP73_22005 [Deltaproteobacteria bacterium]|nr:hypothetical protein [Deltaproteobacteria bacterium]
MPRNDREDSGAPGSDVRDEGPETSPATDAEPLLRADAAHEETGPGPAADASAAPGADTHADAHADAKVCPPQRVVTLDPSTEVPYSELPDVVAEFLISFLSVDYILEHFRFFTRSDSAPPERTVLYVHMTYGIQSVGGTIAWGTAYGDKIVYSGPSRGWEVLVDHATAAKQVEAAGCAMIDYCYDLHFELEQDAPTETDRYGNRGFHLVWATGGGPTTCPSVSGADCECTANRCVVNAETGALDFQAGSIRCLAAPGG